MFTISRGLNPKIVDQLFEFGEQRPYELKQGSQFQIPFVFRSFSF